MVACAALAAAATAHAADCPLPRGMDASSVVPVVWQRAAAEARSASARKDARVMPSQNLNEELTVVFAQRTAKGLSYFRVPAAQAPCWKERSVLARTLSTLVRETSSINTAASPEGVVTIAAGGTFESSLILAQPILVKASGLHVEPLAVGIPARGQLFVADPAQPQAVAQLKAMVDTANRNSPHPLSDRVFLVFSCRIDVLDGTRPADQQTQPCDN